MRKIASWFEENRNCSFLDVGSSIGLYSALALNVAPDSRVYAFDADLVSLKTLLALCLHQSKGRINPVYGLVSDQHTSEIRAAEASRTTKALLESSHISADPAQCAFVCIDGSSHAEIPRYSLDGLFPLETDENRPCMIKCDVEGAELLVLRGSEKFIHRRRPTLLISVHEALGGFGFSKSDVSHWLETQGYSHRVIAVDHEEHWWCDPIAS